MKNNQMIIAVVVVLVVGIGAFFGGMKYQASQPRTGNSAIRSGNFQQRNAGLRPVSGEIISADDKSITVKLQDGSSKIVLLSDSTGINKSAEGNKADLKAGERVVVLGKENSDGSVTAQSIQLNPLSRGFAGSTPSGSPR